MTGMMEQKQSMNQAQMQNMSQMMGEMSVNMQEMSQQMNQGTLDPAAMIKMRERMEAMNKQMEMMQK